MVSALLTGAWGLAHLRSPTVRRWRAGAGGSVQAGPLQVRTFGSGGPVVLLLHGMISSGSSFGAAFDRLGESAWVVVPDLLGFGGSLVTSDPVTGEGHLDALDAMLAALGLDAEPLIVAGHSMGGPLALRFAARHPERVLGVTTLCGALYRDAAEADARVALMGPTEAILVGDGPIPKMLCRWVCAHRRAAGWVAVAVRPDLPLPVALAGVQHTWDSFRGSLSGLLHTAEWEPALLRLGAAGTPVTLAEGGRDPVPVPGRAAQFAAAHSSVRHRTYAGGTHLLPLSHGEWCAHLIAEHLEDPSATTRPREGLRTTGAPL